MINYIISHFTILMAIHPIKQPRKKETRERKHSVTINSFHKKSKSLGIQNQRGECRTNTGKLVDYTFKRQCIDRQTHKQSAVQNVAMGLAANSSNKRIGDFGEFWSKVSFVYVSHNPLQVKNRSESVR